ncbi:hypothetical protein OG824_31785 [Streptomyces prunicolor]|uniref:hypothetical protein n=1 Tax=Streptomyces prunicolor TaxID=67348 RepID=UPI002257D123|nr:hypothetical protein [Streptomyces prunicolor]MCX5239792.1 hypothetical protein [Streptomyces prunicolor]
MKITTVWRALVVLLEDEVRGSDLLARRLVNGVQRAYQGARNLPGRAPAKSSGKGKEKNKPAKSSTVGEGDMPAGAGVPGGKPADGEQGNPTAAKSKGGKKHDKTAMPLLAPNKLIGVAFAAWIVYCFTHRPIERGWHAMAPDLAALLPWAAVWWTVAAWLTAQYDKNGRRAASTESAAGGEADPHAGEARSAMPDTAVVRAAGLWLLHLVCTRVSAAVAEGRKGVHLATLIDEGAVPEEWTVEALREHCGRLGIPVKTMQIRGSGRGPTHGVHVDELVAALGAPLTAATNSVAQLLAEASQNLAPETAPGAAPAPSTEGLSGALAEGAAGPVVGMALGRAEEGSTSPRKGVPFEQLLGAWFAGHMGPTGTPGHTPSPSPAPASPGRG